ncbi:hypothetical protein QTO34_009958 [Cnephaeus nilssonii]|uniref:Uncharacterized protein n=1 Tax=Cnephaeus nilssonii TaxID=3371016 RepID=A0AA40LEH8_CNENI|nr:hypothetical protein QTO34_009958 [Eptesicus nilssonii]
MEGPDDSEVTYALHAASVFCVSLDPKANTLAVTGGEDDKAFVWRLTVGDLDGTLAIYDLSTQTLRHQCQHQAGIVRLWDARTGCLLTDYRGHTAEILDFALSKHASLVVTTSGDHKAKVFCVQRPDR